MSLRTFLVRLAPAQDSVDLTHLPGWPPQLPPQDIAQLETWPLRPLRLDVSHFQIRRLCYGLYFNNFHGECRSGNCYYLTYTADSVFGQAMGGVASVSVPNNTIVSGLGSGVYLHRFESGRCNSLFDRSASVFRFPRVYIPKDENYISEAEAARLLEGCDVFTGGNETQQNDEVYGDTEESEDSSDD